MFVVLHRIMNNKSPSVAIVILNWNGKQYLEKFLPSVLSTDYNNFRVIVVDNGSTDDSISFLKQSFPEVGIIELDKNYGFAGGYNRAMMQVDSKYCVLLNSDVEVTTRWVQPVIELMESDNSIAACQPKILSLNKRDHFEYAGASGGWIDSLGYPFCRGRVFEDCEPDHGQYEDAAPVFWASGAAMFVRSENFKSVGGLDEYLFAHQEEIDLCWRMQNAGYRIFVQPQSLVYHLGGGSLAAGNKKKVFLNFRNNLVVMHKNLPSSGRTWVLLKRMILDGIAGTRFLLQGKWSLFLAVIKAHGSYYKWVFRNYGNNRPIKKSFKLLPGVYSGSIVWDFFLKGKKTFSEIVKNNK